MPKCQNADTPILILCLTNYKSSLLDTKDANRVLNTIFLIFLKKALPEPRKDSGSIMVPYKYKILRHIVVFTELKTGPNLQLNETYQSNTMRLMNEEKTSQ